MNTIAAPKRIMLTGKICGGEINWNIPPMPPADDPVDAAALAKFDAPATCSFFAHLFPDGSLQRVIDYGAELHELEDARQDEEFNRRGC